MVSLSRLQIFEAMESVPPNAQINFLEGYILEKLGISECSVEVKKDLRSSIKFFISKISKRRSQFRKNFDTLYKNRNLGSTKNLTFPNQSSLSVITKKIILHYVFFLDVQNFLLRMLVSERKDVNLQKFYPLTPYKK